MKICLPSPWRTGEPLGVRAHILRIPSMIGLMKRFKRAAVLTDKAWLRKISELERVLYPGLEIKAFNRDQKGQAEAWLSS